MTRLVPFKGAAKLLLFPVTWLLYALSGRISRQNELWVFGSRGDEFSCNTKHLFIHVTESEPDITAVWITGNAGVVREIRRRGGIAHRRWSVTGLWVSLRARFWFVTTTVAEINYYASSNACVVNLWHGVPLKKIYFDSDNESERQRYHAPGIFRRYVEEPFTYRPSSYVVTTSMDVSRKSMSAALRVPLERCLGLGQPRNDILLAPPQALAEYCKRWEQESTLQLLRERGEYERTWIYAPTWRENNPRFLEDTGLDFGALNELLVETNQRLLVKLHLYTPAESARRLRGLSNVVVVPQEADLNVIMAISDGLITDYSSAYVDFMLTGRQIVFFAWDLVEFQKSCRSMYYDYDKVTPGLKVGSAGDLMGVLREVSSKVAMSSAEEALRRMFFDNIDDQSCGRVSAFFKNYQGSCSNATAIC